MNDVWNFERKRDPVTKKEEDPMSLWSRLKQAYDDNLIAKNSLIYKDETLTEDEELSPTLHCVIILHWMNLLHPGLRDLVTQKFSTQLRVGSYAAIFPDIARSVKTFLNELNTKIK